MRASGAPSHCLFFARAALFQATSLSGGQLAFAVLYEKKNTTTTSCFMYVKVVINSSKIYVLGVEGFENHEKIHLVVLKTTS